MRQLSALSAARGARFTQAEVAEMVGVSKRTFAAYERGETAPSIHVARLIAAALDEDVDVLFPHEAVQGGRRAQRIGSRGMTLGARFRAARKDRGLSQDAVSVAAGISLRSLQGYEADAHAPTVPVAILIAEAIGVPPADLLGLVEPPRELVVDGVVYVRRD